MIRRMSITLKQHEVWKNNKWQNLRMRKKQNKITMDSWWKTEFRETCHGIGMIVSDLKRVAKHQKRSSRDMLPDLLSRAHWEVFNVISPTTCNFYKAEIFRPILVLLCQKEVRNNQIPEPSRSKSYCLESQTLFTSTVLHKSFLERCLE